MKWNIFFSILCLCWRLNAVGQIESGSTIIVVTANERELAIAADGRTSGPDSYSNKGCKISAFGDKVVFTVAGRSGPRNDPRSPMWDAHAIAKQQFRRLSAKTAPDALPLELAEAWVAEIKKQVDKRIRLTGSRIVAGLDDDNLMTAVFAGVKKDGTIAAAQATVTYLVRDSKNVDLIPIAKAMPISTSFPWILGRRKILDEMATDTPTAKAWRDAIELDVKRSSDQIAERAIADVDLTINNLPKTNVDRKSVPFSVVGPPISAVRLTSKGIEWIRKGNCPQK